jgi:hypothetical protein
MDEERDETNNVIEELDSAIKARILAQADKQSKSSIIIDLSNSTYWLPIICVAELHDFLTLQKAWLRLLLNCMYGFEFSNYSINI